jgi:hypothetical protein
MKQHHNFNIIIPEWFIKRSTMNDLEFELAVIII